MLLRRWTWGESNEGGGALKGNLYLTGPNSCTCTAPTPILARQGGTQVACRYLSRKAWKSPSRHAARRHTCLQKRHNCSDVVVEQSGVEVVCLMCAKRYRQKDHIFHSIIFLFTRLTCKYHPNVWKQPSDLMPKLPSHLWRGTNVASEATSTSEASPPSRENSMLPGISTSEGQNKNDEKQWFCSSHTFLLYMFQDVSRCFEIFQDVSRCFKKPW